MIKHRFAILLLAVVAASALALGARANVAALDGRVAVLAQPAPAGFSDGGDIPEGFVPIVAQDGFSDGGDIVVLARPAGLGFSDGGDVPEGRIAVFAEPAGGGPSSGGIAPEGLVAVLMDPLPSMPLSPRG